MRRSHAKYLLCVENLENAAFGFTANFSAQDKSNE